MERKVQYKKPWGKLFEFKMAGNEKIPDYGFNSENPGQDIGAWPFVYRAVWLLERGALLSACRDLEHVRAWKELYLEAIKENLPEETLLNAMAEYVYNVYKPSQSLDLVWGMLLGIKAIESKYFFVSAKRFATRVVGLNYNDRWLNAYSLAPGTPLVLIPEPHNAYDPCAVHIYTSDGDDIGYIRQTLAAVLSYRISHGEKFKAYVGIVLGDEFYMDERVNIWVERIVP